MWLHNRSSLKKYSKAITPGKQKYSHHKSTTIKHSDILIHPDDTSIHTRRASSVVSKTSSKSSVASITNGAHFDKHAIKNHHRTLSKDPTGRQSESHGVSKKLSTKKYENLRDRKSQKHSTLHAGEMGLYKNKSLAVINIDDLKLIYSLKTDEDIIRTLSKKLDGRLELTAFGKRFFEETSSKETQFEEKNPDAQGEEKEDNKEISSVPEEPQNGETEENARVVDDYEERRTKLIERYLTLGLEYKFLAKKNLYLQDKLYHIGARKGIIVVEQGNHGRSFKKTRIKLHNSVKITNVRSSNQSTVQNDETGFLPRESITEVRLNKVAANYNKVVQHVSQTLKSKLAITQDTNVHLTELEKKQKESEKVCNKFFDMFMNEMRSSCARAIDANTGHHLNDVETEQFISEMYRLFNKLRNTTAQFYKHWHGLNYSLKSLEQTETQESEGHNMLEYEQLCGENETLKDKFEYREQELEKARSKIFHCIQVLAHFRETENYVDATIIHSSSQLSQLNKRMKQLTEIMDTVAIMYSILSDEQKVLYSESYLFDNVKLLRDFEKTNHKVLELRRTRHEISQQVYHQNHEIKILQQQICKLKDNHSHVRKVIEKEKVKVAERASKKLEEKIRKDKVKQQKMDKLLSLLERRTIEPWKHVREEIMKSDHNLCTSSVYRTVPHQLMT